MNSATECGLETTRGIHQDVSTRWNSTYMMLSDVLYYSDAFVRLKSKDRRRYEKIFPSDDEWTMAATISQCLEIFYNLTTLLSGTSYPTANLFYRGFCDIKDILDKWKYSDDVTIKIMAFAMSEKFEKYWKKSNSALAVASFLDPRYKKKLIEFYMRKFHGDIYQIYVDEFVALLRKMFQHYATSVPTTSTSSKSTVTSMSGLTPKVGVSNAELDAFLYDDLCPSTGKCNDLDKYMLEPLLKQSEFDILSWWKNKKEEYPILSQMARDVMAIQVSTVASESAFSAGGRVIDPYRSRLDPEMVEALICTKDWIAATNKASTPVPSLPIDMEILDEISTSSDVIEDISSDPDDMPHDF